MTGPLGYLDRWNFAPGDTVRLHASGAGQTRIDLVRLHGLQGEGLPTGFRHDRIGVACDVELSERPIQQGSWAETSHGPHVALDERWSWTFTILPTLTDIGNLLEWGRSVFAKIENGDLVVQVGGGQARASLPRGAWSRIEIARDGGRVRLRIAPGGADAWTRSPCEASVLAPKEAVAGGLIIGRGFNGKIEGPTLAIDGDPVAWWNFAANMHGQSVPGCGERGADLALSGAPRRGVTSSSWDGTAHDWTVRPEHYDAIHFHDDDLADCGWPVSHSLTLDADTTSGIYAFRLTNGQSVHHVPFFVRPASVPPVVFLAPTLSYLAYGNSVWASPDGTAIERDFPADTDTMRRCGLSVYGRHRDGSGIGLVSLKRPMLNATPGFVGQAIGDQVLFNDDLRIVDWLDRCGEPFAVVTDHDLHERGVEALGEAGVVVTGTHPEYYSRESLDAMQAFLARGGRLLYIGGNGFYWRVTTLPDAPHVLELRRAENGVRVWAEPHGEYHHQSDGLRGGIWRHLGRPPNALVGIGFSAQGDMTPTRPYRRTTAADDARVAFLFDGVRDGDIGTEGPTGAAGGYELDRADAALGTPPHALVIARTLPFEDGLHPVNEERLTPTLLSAEDPLRADMTFFETSSGGAVLSTGSILFAGRLDESDGAERLLTNALRRFVDPAPFVMPDRP